MEYIKLNDGNQIPILGLGTYQITDQKTLAEVIEAAFESGYEYIDTASYYNNEYIIGQELKNSTKNRADYQIATKVWPSDYGLDKTKRSIENSLKNLDIDYIDLILLHWYGKDFDKAWQVFQDYKRQGIVKSIGVCNFTIKQMEELLKIGDRPVLDQLETHPHLQNEEILNYLKDKSIALQSWSPLARVRGGIMEDKSLLQIAEKHNKTVAQIILRWHIERGCPVIPKSSHADRVKENINIFDFKLDAEDLENIKKLDINKRYSNDPENEKWLKELLDR